MGVLELFDRGAHTHGARACLVEGSLVRTYKEVQVRTRHIAAALRRDGIAAADKVSVYSPNSVGAYEAMLGIYRARGVFVPGNAKGHVTENIYIFNQCDTRALFYHSSLEQEIEQVRNQCPGIRVLVCVDADMPDAPSMSRWLADTTPFHDDSMTQRDALTSIYSTGGTTGRTKGVMFSSLTWDVMTANFLSVVTCPPDPVFLLVSPMTHGAGTSSIALLPMGVTVVIHDRFDAGAVLAAIDRHRVTHLFLPPTAIYMLLEHPALRENDYSSLSCFLYAGAPMSVDKLKDALAVFGPVMMQTYGQTEAPMFCTALTPAEHVAGLSSPKHLASCGRPLLLTPLEIMDDAGRILPPNERGEIVVRGDLVMLGYYNNPEATLEAGKFGWHHTGDIGVKDEDGYVYVLDRKKDMIISGGFNIYPVEVEQVLWSHPAVQECAVIGVPDDKWGEAVKAVIELKPGRTADPTEVMAFCRERLGGVKAPKTVEVWESLPRTPVGKVSKKDVRERFWRGLGRTI